MGSKSQQSTSQQSTTPYNLAGLQNIFNQVQSAASTPYTPYTGELVAPVNQQQTAGINNINANANAAQPYYSQATGYANTAGNPLSQASISSYMNPYTQSVIDATQANFNEANAQQQQQVKGNAAMAGALGGDRQAVAQSELARQQNLSQAPVIAGLQQSNYNQAVSNAQADRSAAANAASLFGNLGTGAQTSALQGAQAQIGAGNLQQQTQQAQDQAAYQQYMQAQAYPFQAAQFFAQYGIPAAVAQGSSSYGTQTAPGPNLSSQIAGLGIAGAGLFLKDGGAVKGYADGGSPFAFIDEGGYGKSYIPEGNGVPSAQLNSPNLQFAKLDSGGNDMKGITSGLGSLKGLFGGESYGGGNIFNSEWGGSSSNPLEGLDASDYGPGFNDGGLVSAIHGIHRAIKRSRGGAVVDMPFAGYAKGGKVRRYADGGDVFGDDKRAIAYDLLRQGMGTEAPDTIPGGEAPPTPPEEPFRLAGPEAMDAWRKSVDQPNPALVADSQVGAQPTSMASAAPANPMRVALPKEITGPEPEEEPSSVMAYDAPRPMAAQAPAAPAEQGFGHSLFGANLSDKARQALVAAGLGMAASRSPFALSAIGEGGLQGLRAYSDITKGEQEAAEKAVSQKQNQTRIDLEAKRIAQSAEQFAKTSSQAERRLKLAEDKTPEGYRLTKDGDYKFIPGGPADPATIKAAAEAKRVPGGVIDDETANFVADQVLAGDNRALIGFGRGAQGAENLLKVRAIVAQKARDQGLDPTDILNKVAIQSGNTAAQRTFGTQTARMAVNATEAQGAIELGRAASAAVPRTNWVPVNRAIQAYQRGTSDPALAKFGAANLAIINTYARAISPTGVPTVNDKQHAEQLLSTATSQEAYNAVLDQMNEEIKIAHAAPQKAKQEIEDIRKGRKTEAAPSGAPAIPAPPPSIPAGSAYSPSRKQWRAPDGTIYNADGSKA